MTKPTIAVLQGDPAGIGPELLLNLLSLPRVTEHAQILVIGDPRVFRRAEQVTGLKIQGITHVIDSSEIDFQSGDVVHLDLNFEGIEKVKPSTVSEAGGRASIEELHQALELAKVGVVHGICFMPFNKESMHLGGNAFTDELGYAKNFLNFDGVVGEFNVAHGMWNGRVTSHVAMKDVPSLLTKDKICNSIALADQTLRLAGYERPKIVVAAYNPHAGDGGLMGREEIDVIAPAVTQMQGHGMDVTGPLPADTLWLKVRDGQYDVVVTMYHDQGQIAIKLLGFDQGVSVLGGLPLPITTPAHGTAFDIAGRNKANVTPTRNAFDMVAEMARRQLLQREAA